MDLTHKYLGIGIMRQGDSVCRAFSRAGAAALALGWINIGCTTQPTHTMTSFILNNARDFEGTGARTGQATDAFFRIHLGDDSTQVQLFLRKEGQRSRRSRQSMADAFLNKLFWLRQLIR